MGYAIKFTQGDGLIYVMPSTSREQGMYDIKILKNMGHSVELIKIPFFKWCAAWLKEWV